MGNETSSLTISETVTNSVTDIIVKNIMQCKNNTSISQLISVKGVGNIVSNVDQNLGMMLSTSCVQTAEQEQKLQDDITNAIMQEANAKNVMFSTGATHSENRSYVKNNISKDINNETLTEAINNVNLQQGITIDGENNIVANTRQNLTAEILTETIHDIVSKADIMTELQNLVDQQAKAVTTDPLSNVVDAYGEAGEKVIGATGKAGSEVIGTTGDALEGVIDTTGKSVGGIFESVGSALGSMWFLFIIIIVGALVAFKMGVFNAFLPSTVT